MEGASGWKAGLAVALLSMWSFLKGHRSAGRGHRKRTGGLTDGPAARKILVVDDEQAIRELLFEALTRANYEVATVARARLALDSVRNSRYDLVLLDIVMPDMDGREFFSTLSHQQPELASRVVFVTGDTASTDTQQFLRRAQRPILYKPFDLDTLREVVAAELDSSLTRSEDT